MTDFSSKKILLVAPSSNSFIENGIISPLRERGIEVEQASCLPDGSEGVTNYNLVIYDMTLEHKDCTQDLSYLDNTKYKTPFFIIVEDSPKQIDAALEAGAADYITTKDESGQVVEKISNILNDTFTDFGGSAIDLTPEKPKVTADGVKVFVVEDDPLLRNLLSIKFEKTNYPFEFSTDGQNIVPVLKQFQPDVIILDLMLPGRSGFEVLADIKEDKELEKIPVIIFSNRDSQEDRQKADKMGAAGFYVKAMTDLSELVETIQEVIKKNKK